MWHIQEWYKTTQKVRGAGKAQKLTDKLTAMKVSDISDLDAKYPPETDRYGCYSNGIIYFERLEDGWSVLRMFARAYNSGALYERERIYIHDNGANRIVSNTNGNWFPSAQDISYNHYVFVNKSEAMEKCKRLKYILPLVENDNSAQIKKSIINILRFPEIEQMISLGYTKAAKCVAHSSTPKATLRHMFGEYYAEKEKTILRKSGLTKHQLDKYMSVYNANQWYERKCSGALLEMRKLFGDSLKHLDNESFDMYYDGFVSIHRGYGG